MSKSIEGEVAKHSFRKIVLGFLTTLFAGASICAAGGFIYLKYIETRLHKGNEGLEKVISNPIGDEPMNFLILGSDARGNEKARADTIILLHLDAKKKKAVLVSIPRDMRVQIPGKGYNKINAAHSYGGSELMVRTVEDFTGFTIHHYVETDFNGFQKMVDALGGVEIYIEKPMNDKLANAFFARGYHTLSGPEALAFVRSRKFPRGDFDRAKNQQTFLRALYKKAKEPASLTKLPKLIGIFADNSTTDLTSSELLSFASLIRSIPEESLETVTLEGTSKKIKGVSYVIPDDTKNKEILARIKEGKSVEDVVLGYSEQVQPKDVKVKVLNGGNVVGLASKVKDKLAKDGFKVLAAENADRNDYTKTKILYRDGQAEKAKCVKKYLASGSLEVSKNLTSEADVVVIIGKDYKSG